MPVFLTRFGGAFGRLFVKLFGVIVFQFTDLGITFLNLVTFRRGKTSVIQAGKPGAGGIWPEYTPPGAKDSRSPCPALNALANHGILPHDGRNIPFTDLCKAIKENYNFSSTFSFFVPHYAAEMLGRDYYKDTVNLSDLNVHNGIEHDASLTRLDTYHAPDQSKPDHALIDRLLACASGKDRASGRVILTNGDVAKFSHIRRTEAKANNPQFMLDTMHKVFGSNNSATMTTIFGGYVDDLEIWLKEERLPEGWQPRIRDRFGHSMMSFNRSVFAVEFRIPNTPYQGAEVQSLSGGAKSETV